MTIAFDSSGQVVGTTASLLVDITSAATGAWCYCHVQISSNVGATTFTGWTLVAEKDEATFDHAALWRRLKIAGDTTFTVSWSGAQNATAVWSSYTGVDTATPDEFATQLDHTSSGTAYLTASQAPADATRWAAASFGYRSTTAARTWTNATLTQRQDAENTTSRWSGSSIADSNGTVTAALHSYTATLSVTESHGSTFIWFLVPVGGATTPLSAFLPNIVVPRVDRARFRRQLPYMSRNRLAYPPPGVSGPTAWTQAVDATLTFAGIRPVLAIQRATTPTLTFAGSTTKKTVRDLGAVTLTFVGSLVRTPGKALGAALIFAGSRPVTAITHGLTGVLTFTGAAPHFISHTLPAATLTFVGAATKQSNRPLAAVLSFAGAISKGTSRPLAAALSLAGSRPSIFLQRPLSGSQGFTGAVSKLVGRALGGTLTFSGLLDSIKTTGHAFVQSFTAALGFAGQENAQTGRPITGVLTLAGQRPSLLVSRSLAGVQTFAGSIIKSTVHAIKPTLTFVGSNIKSTTHALTAELKFFVATGLPAKLTARAVAPTLTFAGSASKSTVHAIRPTLTFIVATVKSTTHTITPTLTFAGTNTKSTARALTATLTWVGNFLRGRLLGATLGFVGAQTKSTTKALTPSLGFIGNLNRFSTRALAGVLSVSGGFNKLTVRTLPAAVLTFAGSINKSPGKALVGALSLVGSRPVMAIVHVFNPVLSSTGNLNRAMTRALIAAALTFSGAMRRTNLKSVVATLTFTGLRTHLYFPLQVGTLYVFHALKRVFNYIAENR